VGLLKTAATVAVASSVHGRIQRRQQARWAAQDQANAAAAPAPPRRRRRNTLRHRSSNTLRRKRRHQPPRPRASPWMSGLAN
jgi:acetyl-CoA acetyltransferase